MQKRGGGAVSAFAGRRPEPAGTVRRLHAARSRAQGRERRRASARRTGRASPRRRRGRGREGDSFRLLVDAPSDGGGTAASEEAGRPRRLHLAAPRRSPPGRLRLPGQVDRALYGGAALPEYVVRPFLTSWFDITRPSKSGSNWQEESAARARGLRSRSCRTSISSSCGSSASAAARRLSTRCTHGYSRCPRREVLWIVLAFWKARR
mmetsp:Transcript_25258/g.77884  ORF Transcript_25258/g.77884 Transcript_25258/m.77884 type:complete len:207 (-) Transcript_25258:30-650(-)